MSAVDGGGRKKYPGFKIGMNVNHQSQTITFSYEKKDPRWEATRNRIENLRYRIAVDRTRERMKLNNIGGKPK